MKADALSRLYDTEERPVDPTPILPASCLVAPVVWEVDAEIEEASRSEPAPPQLSSGNSVRTEGGPGQADSVGSYSPLIGSSWH